MNPETINRLQKHLIGLVCDRKDNRTRSRQTLSVADRKKLDTEYRILSGLINRLLKLKIDKT